MATPPSGASAGATSGGPNAPKNPMAQGTDLYNYISKLSIDLQNGVIDLATANELNARARQLAGGRGQFGSDVRQALRYGDRRIEGPPAGGDNNGGTTGTTGSTGNTGTTTPAPGPEYTPVVTGATEYLEALLANAVGVTGLGNWASNLYMKGASPLEIIQALRYGMDKSPEGQSAYQKYLSAFPGMDEFLKDGTLSGEAPEMQYISYRNAVKEAASRYGINADLTSPSKVYTYLKNKVSAAEVAERMSTAATAVATTPVETLTLLNEYYGVGSSDLISFFLDTDETEAMLQKRYTAARIGTEAVRNQFGVNVTEAEALATRGVGVQQAAEGFQTAAQRRSFMAGAGETASREQLIGASFGDVEAEQSIARIGGSRAGRFAEGGGFAAGQEGVSGLGSATR